MSALYHATTLRITVGSHNPVKIDAAKQAISLLLPNAEIICQGMHANVDASFAADLYIAMEGGVDNFEHGPATYAYMAIIYQGKVSIGRSAQLPLPQAVYQALEQGEELGHVMDRLFNTVNIKQKGGAIGLLTDGKATRGSIYTQALILAMAPFLNPQVFNTTGG